MFRYFAVEKDPGMLIFLTDADMSLNSERERLEDKLTQRTGVKCVVIDCVGDPPSTWREAQEPFWVDVSVGGIPDLVRPHHKMAVSTEVCLAHVLERSRRLADEFVAERTNGILPLGRARVAIRAGA